MKLYHIEKFISTQIYIKIKKKMKYLKDNSGKNSESGKYNVILWDVFFLINVELYVKCA